MIIFRIRCSLRVVIFILVTAPVFSSAQGQSTDRNALVDQVVSELSQENFLLAAKTAQQLSANERAALAEEFELAYLSIKRQCDALVEDRAFAESASVAETLVTYSKSVFGDSHHKTTSAKVQLQTCKALSRFSDNELAIYDTMRAETKAASANDRVGKFREAADSWSRAAAASQKLFGKESESNIDALHGYGSSLSEAGEFAEAIDVLKRAVEASDKLYGLRHPNSSYPKSALGGLYLRIGDFARAEPLSRNNLEQIRRSKGTDADEYLYATNNLGFCYLSMGEYDKAEPLLVESLALRQRKFGKGHRLCSVALNNLGLLHLNRGEFEEGARLFSQASEITEKLLGNAHPVFAMRQKNLALCNLFLKRYRPALQAMENVVRIRGKTLGMSHIDYAESLIHLAEIAFAMNQPEQAGEHARNAFTIATNILEEMGASQTEREQLALLSRLRHYFHFAVSGTSDPTMAYELALQFKGIVLEKQRRQRQLIANAKDASINSLSAQLADATSQLAALSTAGQTGESATKIEQLSEFRDELVVRLSRSVPHADRKRKRLTLQRLQQTLPKDTALVDFVTMWETTYDASANASNSSLNLIAFVIKPGESPRRFRLGRAAEHVDMISEFREAIVTDDPIGVRRVGSILRSQVWDPFASLLADIKTVAIVPDGTVTANLPFIALPGEKADSYLLDQKSIISIPSPHFLNHPKEKSFTTDRSLLVVGDVDFGVPSKVIPTPLSPRDVSVDGSLLADIRGKRAIGWAALPQTANELLNVTKTFEESFPGRKKTVLKKSDATEARIKTIASDFTYLHFATHGFFTPRAAGGNLSEAMQPSFFGRGGVANYFKGLQSGLVFAGGNQSQASGYDDGILTALEIETVNLSQAKLVVLSACDTGLGANGGSEGILGLQRSLHLAGCESVVASLWKVDDYATMSLMTLFYKNLFEKRISKAEALRQAQLSMLNNPRDALNSKSNHDFRAPGSLKSVKKKSLKSDSRRLEPRYWAAFSLSGDWR